MEFCVRAVKGGIHICYESDAVVRHRYDCTAVGLFRCLHVPRPPPSSACLLHTFSLIVVLPCMSCLSSTFSRRAVLSRRPVGCDALADIARSC